MEQTYIPQGVQEASAILSKSTNYLVYGDPDIDGLVAMSLVMQLLQYYGKPYQYHINENRAHGFMLPIESLEKLRGMTIIAVDFSISCEMLRTIVDRGVNIINIDHHETHCQELFTYENNGCSAVLINNQYCFEPESQRFQSGAGMVYHTFVNLLPEFMDSERNRALVGMTLLSDVREIENNNAMKFLETLYAWHDKYSEYLISLTKGAMKPGFGEQRHLDRNYVDFSFSPKFNALFRLNMGDIAVKLFNKQEVNINLNHIKEQQDNIVRDLLPRMTCEFESESVRCIGINISGYGAEAYNITNFIGLLGSRLLDEYDTTIFIYARNESGIQRGSVRGKCDGVDYLSVFEGLPNIEAAGHKNAFGVYCHTTEIPFEAISNGIKEVEAGYDATAYMATRVIPCINLYTAVLSEKSVPRYNTFVRDSRRRVYDCSTCDYTIAYESETKNYIVYSINGVTVKCFDKELNPHNGGFVMPMYVNGYIEYFLKKL